MEKENKKLALCATEKIELDLTSCWIEADSPKENAQKTVKTIAITKSNDI